MGLQIFKSICSENQEEKAYDFPWNRILETVLGKKFLIL